MTEYIVGLRQGKRSEVLTIEAEDALIAALKVKHNHPEAVISYVRKLIGAAIVAILIGRNEDQEGAAAQAPLAVNDRIMMLFGQIACAAQCLARSQGRPPSQCRGPHHQCCERSASRSKSSAIHGLGMNVAPSGSSFVSARPDVTMTWMFGKC